MSLNNRLDALETKQKRTNARQNTNRYGVLVTQYLNAKHAGNKERMVEIKIEMKKELENRNGY